jgi:predicted amidohydrolase YtcJ
MSNKSADIIIHNAHVITLDPNINTAEMIAIKGNLILAVGGKKDVARFTGPNTRMIDCDGKTVVPGFNDSHCHPIPFAITMRYVDCSPSMAKSIAEIQDRLRRHSEGISSSRWIRAAKYNESQLIDKRHPTRKDLDEATPHNPTILVHDSGKQCVLNSLALQLLGITKDTPDHSGGYIGRDENTGEPNGIIYGRNETVERGIPSLDEEELQQGIRLANQEYLSHGITSIQDTTWSNSLRHWKYFQEIKESGILTPRITMFIGSDAVPDFQGNDLRTGYGDARLRIGGAKIALDESTGNDHPPQQELNGHALRAHRAGFQLAFHVSDIYSLQTALTTLQFIKQNDSKPCLRPRLEHCAFCPSEFIPQLNAFHVTVATQPSFFYYLGETYRQNTTAEQKEWLYPLRSFQRQDVRTAISSDSPLFSCNPFVGLYAAVTRKDKTGCAITPQESISLSDALASYTIWPAYASLEESLKGTITPGKLADLIVLSDDITKIEPEELLNIKVVMTIMDGKVAWEG